MAPRRCDPRTAGRGLQAPERRLAGARIFDGGACKAGARAVSAPFPQSVGDLSRRATKGPQVALRLPIRGRRPAGPPEQSLGPVARRAAAGASGGWSMQEGRLGRRTAVRVKSGGSDFRSETQSICRRPRRSGARHGGFDHETAPARLTYANAAASFREEARVRRQHGSRAGELVRDQGSKVNRP